MPPYIVLVVRFLLEWPFAVCTLPIEDKSCYFLATAANWASLQDRIVFVPDTSYTQISYIYLLGIALVYLLTHTLEHLSTFNTTWAVRSTCSIIIALKASWLACFPFCLTDCLKGLISSGFLLPMWDFCIELPALHRSRGKGGMCISSGTRFQEGQGLRGWEA